MKHILTTLLLPALLVISPVSRAQDAPEESADSPTPAAGAPNDSIVDLYPDKATRKKLKMKKYREALSPYGIVSTGKSILVFGGLIDIRNGDMKQDIVLSSSKDGRDWDKVGVAVPQTGLTYVGTSNLAAIFDSVRNQLVLFYCCEPVPVLKPGQSLSDSKPEPQFFVALGKAGKFSKPKEITRQFKGIRRGDTDFRIENHGLYFQGICLEKGEHRGRLLLLACFKDKTVCSIYSDDHGRTWKTGKAITVRRASTGSVGGGLTLCEADDGTVVSFTGNQGQTATWICSDDGGTSWKEKTSKPEQQASQPGWWPQSYLALNTRDGQGTESRLLAFSFINNEKHQTHVAISYDWGLTWPHQKTIEASTLVQQSNPPIQPIAPGTMGLLTCTSGETGADNALVDAGFTTFTLSWLTDGKDDGIDEKDAAAQPTEANAAEDKAE